MAGTSYVTQNPAAAPPAGGLNPPPGFESDRATFAEAQAKANEAASPPPPASDTGSAPADQAPATPPSETAENQPIIAASAAYKEAVTSLNAAKSTPEALAAFEETVLENIAERNATFSGENAAGNYIDTKLQEAGLNQAEIKAVRNTIMEGQLKARQTGTNAAGEKYLLDGNPTDVETAKQLDAIIAGNVKMLESDGLAAMQLYTIDTLGRPDEAGSNPLLASLGLGVSGDKLEGLKPIENQEDLTAAIKAASRDLETIYTDALKNIEGGEPVPYADALKLLMGHNPDMTEAELKTLLEQELGISEGEDLPADVAGQFIKPTPQG